MDFVPPALATRVLEVPDGADWLHEPKLDGYRMQCHVSGKRAVLFSRNGLDWSARFPNVIAAAISVVNGGRAVLDGEILVPTTNGASPFQALQAALRSGEVNNAVYWVFDLLCHGRRDLRSLSLDERRAGLAQLLRGKSKFSPIQLTHALTGAPAELLAAACKRGDEGIISKRRSARYPIGRSREWLKIKCGERDELVIIGFSPPAGAREHFGALLLATRTARGSPLLYAGRVGSGFSGATLATLRTRLERIERDNAPCPVPRALTNGVRWVEPVLVAEVAFAEWTADRLLRQATFLGLREDKEAFDVRKESAVDAASADRTVQGITISHADRVVFDGVGITKHDLALYYEAVAPLMLPHIASRPLSTLRCPDGPQATCFFQKHWKATRTSAVRTMSLTEGDGSSDEYAIAGTAADLIRLVQMNVIEIHPWASKRRTLESPDRLILDLDPGPGVAWPDVRDAAMQVRALLDSAGLRSWVKLSGGKGVHVTVPLDRTLSWDQFSAFARLVAGRLAADLPRTFIDKAAKDARKNRIFIDWLRNARGATAAAPWSVRARANAPVAATLDWNELGFIDGADVFTVPVAMSYLALSPADVWEGMLSVKQRVTAGLVAKLAPT